MVYLWQQLLAVHFLHGMAIQVDLVATVAKDSSFCVLFHGLDPSRRNAFQSSAKACKMQLVNRKESLLSGSTPCQHLSAGESVLS